MSNHENQEVLLLAIEYLKIQYKSLQNPCIALLISRYYRLLANLSMTNNIREKYVKHSNSWLACHVSNPEHSEQMQNQLNQLVQLNQLNQPTL